MKIAIITLWDTQDNYGGVLQNYALQQVLSRFGHFPFLIRFKQSSFLLSIKLFAKFILSLKNKKKLPHDYKNRNFDGFRETNINQSDKIYQSSNSLSKNLPKADLYITGSDQVWNYATFDGSGDPYFLSFKEKEIRRLSYAASFGSINIHPKFLNYISPKLRKFDFISVRESDGVNICEKAGLDTKDIAVVCDPTMLLNKSDYGRISDKSALPQKKFCFTYFLGWATSIPKEEITQFTAKANISLLYTPSQGMDFSFFDPYAEATYLQIPQWISAIDEASCVITNSFHGTLFAILHHTKFVVIPVGGRKKRMNSRIETLLEKVGLSRCIYSKKGDIDAILNEDYDWAYVDNKINEWKLFSETWLKKAIEEIGGVQ